MAVWTQLPRPVGHRHRISYFTSSFIDLRLPVNLCLVSCAPAPPSKKAPLTEVGGRWTLRLGLVFPKDSCIWWVCVFLSRLEHLDKRMEPLRKLWTVVQELGGGLGGWWAFPRQADQGWGEAALGSTPHPEPRCISRTAGGPASEDDNAKKNVLLTRVKTKQASPPGLLSCLEMSKFLTWRGNEEIP